MTSTSTTPAPSLSIDEESGKHRAPDTRNVATPNTPFHAVLVVAAAWAFCVCLVAFYSVASMLLLPLLPLFLFGPVCLLGAAHDYARDARERNR